MRIASALIGVSIPPKARSKVAHIVPLIAPNLSSVFVHKFINILSPHIKLKNMTYQSNLISHGINFYP